MKTSRFSTIAPGVALLALCVMAGWFSAASLSGQVPAPAPSSPAAQASAKTAADLSVPKNLKPLLLPRRSEMRLVVDRYTQDRATLESNFIDGIRIGGRPGGPNQVKPEPVSTRRLARLARFDVDWQQALGTIDPARLTPVARQDLSSLRQLVHANRAELDFDAANIAQVASLIPFAPPLVDLVESRIRIEQVDPQKAAGTLAQATRDLIALRARIEAGLSGATGATVVRVDAARARKAAAAITTLRTGLNDWFIFFNSYDPMFTWWVNQPYKKFETALQDYATFLTGPVSTANLTPTMGGFAMPASTAAGPAPTFASVPDLQELIALPQDEMAGIVERFKGPAPGGRQGGPQTAPLPTRDTAFYRAWLAALKTLDFARLTRNAQVDYLYIKKMCELQIARAGVTLPPNPPRKADNSGITGAARGREGLIADLQDELVPYTPEALITFAEAEFAYCEREMKKASNQLGLGDDWKKALEKMKTMGPPPGGQKYVIRDLVFEAIDYLRAKDLLTVPAVAAESQHMIMMTPERQLVNPFFTGGFQISVSYPTDTMDYEQRIQSLRGNNTPFSHATAFHEMIPGHNLVFYTNARYRSYRPRLGGNSPFFGEGWPLYWELMMYEMGFHDTPEKKIGALFWRMHRCARIIFSLKFHMGQWSPQECVDFLVDRVGFERENAMGEVRRSFQGGYGPLYQAAYLLGGLQMRAMRRELVDAGGMPQKVFHDEVLRQGDMPIALLRVALSKQPLTPATSVDWMFLEQAASK